MTETRRDRALALADKLAEVFMELPDEEYRIAAAVYGWKSRIRIYPFSSYEANRQRAACLIDAALEEAAKSTGLDFELGWRAAYLEYKMHGEVKPTYDQTPKPPK